MSIMGRIEEAIEKAARLINPPSPPPIYEMEMENGYWKYLPESMKNSTTCADAVNTSLAEFNASKTSDGVVPEEPVPATPKF